MVDTPSLVSHRAVDNRVETAGQPQLEVHSDTELADHMVLRYALEMGHCFAHRGEQFDDEDTVSTAHILAGVEEAGLGSMAEKVVRMRHRRDKADCHHMSLAVDHTLLLQDHPLEQDNVSLLDPQKSFAALDLYCYK